MTTGVAGPGLSFIGPGAGGVGVLGCERFPWRPRHPQSTSMSGLGFGVFLVVLKVGSTHGLIWQLIYSRMASATLALGIVLWVLLRGTARQQGASWRKQVSENRFLGVAGSAGVLEATGSLLYMRSASEGRLDVAAGLASLYPVARLCWRRVI